jgi:hypothetical protein
MSTTTLKEYKIFICGGYTPEKPVIIDKDGEPLVVAFFTDCELDPYYVTFSDDETCSIYGAGKYTMLPRSTLSQIDDMFEDAAALWEQLDPYFDGEDFVGWEHLATKPIEGNA